MNSTVHSLPFQAENRQSLLEFFRDYKNIRLNRRAKKLFEFILHDCFVVCAADVYPVTQFTLSGFSNPACITETVGNILIDLNVPKERHNARVKLALLKTILLAREQETLPYFKENGSGNCFGWYRYSERVQMMLMVYRSVETIDQQHAVLNPIIQIDAIPVDRAYVCSRSNELSFTEFAEEAKVPYLHV